MSLRLGFPNILISAYHTLMSLNFQVGTNRDVSVFYLFRHLTSTRPDLTRLGRELGGKLRGQVHLTVCRDIWMVTGFCFGGITLK